MRSRSISPIVIRTSIVLTALLSSQGLSTDPKPAKGWTDLPMAGHSVSHLKLSARFLGPIEEGWGQVGKKMFPNLESTYLPDGLIVVEKPTLKDSSADSIGRWFAHEYVTRNVSERGTVVRDGVALSLLSRGPETFPGNEIKVKAYRRRGNVILVHAHIIRKRGLTTKTTESVWWPLLQLSLEKLPQGVYAVEVIWFDEQIDPPKSSRQLTAFSVTKIKDD